MKTNYFSKLLFTSLILSVQFLYSQAQTVNFEDLTLQAESHWSGSDGSGGFTSGGVYFYNQYTTSQWGDYWSGFVYSNTTDIITESNTNDFSAFTGRGYKGSSNYAVGTGASGLKLVGAAEGRTLNGFMVTNTTYATLSMQTGDQFAKIFGGASGNDPDWFKLTITGYLNKIEKNTKVDFYLADFRFADNARDYIITNWKWVDLSGLGNVDSLSFSLSSSDNSFGFMNTPGYFAMDNFNDPLFAPAANAPNTSAISKDNSSLIAWATACTVTRGPKDISNTALGVAETGDATMAIGQAGTGVVSLGDGGKATLTFANPIVNGTGADFAVFENGFTIGNGAFLELAFVEVSSDGTRFVRFPSMSLTSDTLQKDNAGAIDARLIYNLAGKYVANYGTPFDLEDVKDSVGLDVNNITHVRVVDVVGSVLPNYASYDSYGNRINDPWPTAFASSGFDLDAVGVLHTATSTGIFTAYRDDRFTIYPNPSNRNQELTISLNFAVQNEISVQIFDHSGQLVKEQSANSQEIKIASEDLISGMYMVKLTDGAQVITKKIVIN